MDKEELKQLINDSKKLHSFAEKYFFPLSKDNKTIPTIKQHEIIQNICDEYGFEVPSKNEIEQLDKKQLGFANTPFSIIGAFSNIIGMIGQKPGMEVKKSEIICPFITFNDFMAYLKLNLQVIERKM